MTSEPSTRPNPCAEIFGALAAERFPPIRAGLEAAGCDPRDRDAFLLQREVAELLRELRPEEGMGTAVEALVALVQHAYLFWSAGERVEAVSDERLARLLGPGGDGGSSGSRYVQLPRLRVWGKPIEGRAVEPLDGWFVSRSDDRVVALAVFGLSPGRDGLTTVEVAGGRPTGLHRPDGSPLFSPTLPGGAAAGLASITGAEELLELVWRAESA